MTILNKVAYRFQHRSRSTTESIIVSVLLNYIRNMSLYSQDAVIRHYDCLASQFFKGIILSGGVALMRGFAERLSRSVNTPVIVAEKPLFSVALGVEKILENLGVFCWR